MMNIKIKYLQLNIFTVLLLSAGYFFDYLNIYLIAYLAAALHEISHIVMGLLLKVKFSEIKILPFGITVKMREAYIRNTTHEAIIALAGPVMSLTLGLVGGIIGKYYDSAFLEIFTMLSLAIGFINLVPCLPLDGGRVLKAFLTNHWGFFKAVNTLIILTRIIGTGIILFSIYLLLTQGFNFSFIIIGAFLLANLTGEARAVNIIAMKEIIQNKEKLKNDSINKVRVVAVFDTTPARLILKYFSYNYYYIIEVLNNNAEVINTVTETQIIDALSVQGIRVKMGDIAAAV